MYYPSIIYKFPVVNKLQKYADKTKLGTAFYLFGHSKIKLYLSEKKVVAYASQNLAINEQQRLKTKLSFKYQRNVEIKKTVMGYVVPEGFILNEKGMIAIKETTTKDGDVKTQYLHISNRWLFVDYKIYSQYHDIFQYEVKSYDPRTKKSKTELCMAENLGKWGFCVSFLMNSLAVVTEEAYKKELTTYFNKFILENIRNIKAKITLPHMGWNEQVNEFFPYSEKLHFDFTGDTSKYLKNTVKAFKPAGNKNEFISKLKDFTKNENTDFIISSAFAAPLLKIIGIRSFSINFFGESGNMKSLAAKMAISCFGNSEKLTSSGNHTKNVLIEKLSKFHNLPFYVDEITEDSMDIYSIGNETGRHRLNKAGQILETISWRTLMFCTSETSMAKDSNKGGEVNRLLCLPVDCTPDKFQLDDEEININKEEYARDLYLFLEKNYGLLGEEYIKTIIPKKGKIKNIYSYIVNKIFDPLKQKQHTYMIAAVCLANYIYRKIFFKTDDINYSIALGHNFMSKVKRKKDLDPVIKLYEAIYEFYEINQAAFRVGNYPQKTNYCYGTVKEGKVFFILNPLKEYLTRSGFNWNEKKSLIDRKLIEYKSARIDGEMGKRIVMDIEKNIDDVSENDIYSVFERDSIRKEGDLN